MFFYALFALGLQFPSRQAGIVTVIAALMSLVTAGAIWHPPEVITAFYSAPILLEFAGGMLIGLAAHRRPMRWPGTKLAQIILCLLGFLMASALIHPLDSWPRPVSIGIPALFIVACAVSLNLSGKVVSNPLLLRLGDASYSIYLTHPFVTQAVARIARGHLNSLTAVLLVAVTMALVCVTGLLVHYYVELPLIRGWKSASAWVLAPNP